MLRDDEGAWIGANQGRCLACDHLLIFHTIDGEDEVSVCHMGECPCVDGSIEPRPTPVAHQGLLAHPALLSVGAAPTEGSPRSLLACLRLR